VETQARASDARIQEIGNELHGEPTLDEDCWAFALEEELRVRGSSLLEFVTKLVDRHSVLSEDEQKRAGLVHVGGAGRG
jgi:hypothetical protein